MTIARVVVFGVVLLVWSPTGASAEPLPITWSAPPGCPSLRDVTSWLEAVVPAELRTRLAGVTAEVHITRVERTYRAEIVVTHDAWTGEREVEGRRCEEVARSAIVIVSVSLAEAVEVAERDVPVPPVLGVVEPDPVVVPESPPEPPSVASVPPPTPIVPTPLPDEPTRPAMVDVGAGVVFGFGTDALAPRLGAAVTLAPHENATLGVRVQSVPRARVERATASADIALVTVGVEGCGRFSPSQIVHAAGCLRVDAGTLIAAGRELDMTQRGHAPWVAVAFAPSLELGSRARFRLAAGLEVRVVRPRLTVDGIGDVYHSPTLGGGLDLGLIILIP